MRYEWCGQKRAQTTPPMHSTLYQPTPSSPTHISLNESPRPPHLSSPTPSVLINNFHSHHTAPTQVHTCIPPASIDRNRALVNKVMSLPEDLD